MIANIFYFCVGAVVIWAGIYLAINVGPHVVWMWPAIPAFFVGLVYLKLLNLRWPGWTWAKTLIWRPIHLIAVGGWSLAAGISGWTLLKDRASLLEMFIAVIGVIASAVTLHWAARSLRMSNIFAVLDDPSQFEAFAEGVEAQVTVEINAEALSAAIKQDVIGQDQIVDEIASALERRARLRRPNKPLGVFMLVGATGSGKTELAKALARHAFSGGGKGQGRLVRIDCNEMTEASSTQRLIGSPPGYAGCENGGQLTREIKKLKSGVILLDEIEKAHPDVFKLIMGLLDEGRMTEQSTGETVDASNFVVILTSNAKQDVLAKLRDTIADKDDRARAVRDTLTAVFAREQLARMDEIYCFMPHTRRSLAQIVGKALFGYAGSVGVELVSVDTDVLIQTIEAHEKRSDYGIRELLRMVERAVVDGMLDAKDAGHTHVAVLADGHDIRVVGLDAKGARSMQAERVARAVAG